MTIVDRRAKRSPEARAETPADSDVVTAISSGDAPTSAREHGARRLLPLDPVLPRRTLDVPVAQVVGRTPPAPHPRAPPASTS